MSDFEDFEHTDKHLNKYASPYDRIGKRFENRAKPMRIAQANFATWKKTITMKKHILTFLAFSLALCCTAVEPRNEISTSSALANIGQGKIAGYTENGINIYKGIPYAKAERFMAPQAPGRWEGTRSCRNYGPTCPQAVRQGWQNDEIAFAFNWDDGYPGEDCLRANVWTPAKSADGGKRPVMVWLHGGGFSAGSGQELPGYDGANLARKGDVVVVTVNHRLNVLGFLDLSDFGPEYAQSGNAGLLDLVAALKWVKDNAEAFGGDPENVTIFGQSGGGGKVSTLCATPAAKGLFHKAIVQSGSTLSTMTSEHSKRIGRAVVKELGLENDVKKLSSLPYTELLAAADKAVAKVRAEVEAESGTGNMFIFGWAPTVDGNILPAQPFSDGAPEQSRDIPMLIGTTKCEFSATTYVPMLRNADAAMAEQFVRSQYGDNTAALIKAYEKAYPGYRPKDLIDFDTNFRPNAVRQADIKSAQKGAPVYMYLFTWESPVLDGILRSTHCMEIPFVFNNAKIHASMTGGGADAEALADKMSDAWLAFARTGNPNAPSLPEWPAYTPENGATMFFDNECTVHNNHDRELLDFVRSVKNTEASKKESTPI